jgi:hypothetical protein
MRKLWCICLLSLPLVVKAQLFSLYDGSFTVIEIEPGTTVSVRYKYPVMDGNYEYRRKGDITVCRYSEGDVFDSSFHSEYPFLPFIPLRNNHFFHAIIEGDSIIHHGKFHRTIISTPNYYYKTETDIVQKNDTTFFIKFNSTSYNLPNGCYIQEVIIYPDKKLKVVRALYATRDSCDLRSFSEHSGFDEMRFIYKGNRLMQISYYIVDKSPLLIGKQVFEYQNGKVIRSKVYGEGKLAYEYEYTYMK